MLDDTMQLLEATGYLASGLVVVAFCMKDIITLRCVALTSNIAFLIYGIGFGLSPVCLLHTILLPINGWRLCQAVRWDLGTNSEPAVRDPRRATPGTFPLQIKERSDD